MLNLYDVEGYEKAVPLLLEALEDEPDRVRARADLAMAFSAWGWRRQIVGQPSEDCYQSAYDHAQKALSEAPWSDDAHRAMAAALRAGYWKDPVRRFDEARLAHQLAPDKAENCYELWRADGSVPGAGLAERAIDLDPSLCAVHIDLGAAYAEAGRHEEAVRHLTRALDINPRNALAYYDLAMVCLLLDHPEKARALLERALAAQPGDPLLLLGLKFARASA
jgi:tetratricopeptide (TPR) repeat protein